ncbi:MAG: hypothetical protein RIS35_642 [Pseudomonadota bacterium]|jgi:dihydrofolate reductase
MSVPAAGGRSAASSPRVSIVVARARNGVIGRANGLPWHLPEDLRHFRATTTGHAILMGRKTFESIGRALPGRRTIVITRDPDWRFPECERAGSLDEAIALAARPGANPAISTDEVFVVGGAQIYAQALPIADRIVLTEIDLEVDGDAFFPALPDTGWREASRASMRSSAGPDFSIVDLRRS